MCTDIDGVISRKLKLKENGLEIVCLKESKLSEDTQIKVGGRGMIQHAEKR